MKPPSVATGCYLFHAFRTSAKGSRVSSKPHPWHRKLEGLYARERRSMTVTSGGAVKLANLADHTPKLQDGALSLRTSAQSQANFL